MGHNQRIRSSSMRAGTEGSDLSITGSLFLLDELAMARSLLQRGGSGQDSSGRGVVITRRVGRAGAERGCHWEGWDKLEVTDYVVAENALQDTLTIGSHLLGTGQPHQEPLLWLVVNESKPLRNRDGHSEMNLRGVR